MLVLLIITHVCYFVKKTIWESTTLHWLHWQKWLMDAADLYSRDTVLVLCFLSNWDQSIPISCS